MYAIWGETLMKRAEVNLLLEKVYTFIMDAQRVSGKFFNSPALELSGILRRPLCDFTVPKLMVQKLPR
jgi:hypothetical protein